MRLLNQIYLQQQKNGFPRFGHQRSFELIGFGSEIVSGGMRVNRYDEQIERIKSKGLNPEDFADYLMMHKFGIPPEGGFGMGVQRLTQNVLGLENIKEATLFPRDVQRLRP